MIETRLVIKDGLAYLTLEQERLTGLLSPVDVRSIDLSAIHRRLTERSEESKIDRIRPGGGPSLPSEAGRTLNEAFHLLDDRSTLDAMGDQLDEHK